MWRLINYRSESTATWWRANRKNVKVGQMSSEEDEEDEEGEEGDKVQINSIHS